MRRRGAATGRAWSSKVARVRAKARPRLRPGFGRTWCRYGSAPASCAPASSLSTRALEEHDGGRLGHDPEVLEDAAPPQILEVVANLDAHVVDCAIGSLADLCQAGN